MRKWFLQPILDLVEKLFGLLTARLTLEEHMRRDGDNNIHRRFDALADDVRTTAASIRAFQMEAHQDALAQIALLKEELARVHEAARGFCSMYEHEAADYATRKVLHDEQFCKCSTEGEQVEEAAKWAGIYLAEHGIKRDSVDLMRALVAAQMEREQRKSKK